VIYEFTNSRELYINPNSVELSKLLNKSPIPYQSFYYIYDTIFLYTILRNSLAEVINPIAYDIIIQLIENTISVKYNSISNENYTFRKLIGNELINIIKHLIYQIVVIPVSLFNDIFINHPLFNNYTSKLQILKFNISDYINTYLNRNSPDSNNTILYYNDISSFAQLYNKFYVYFNALNLDLIMAFIYNNLCNRNSIHNINRLLLELYHYIYKYLLANTSISNISKIISDSFYEHTANKIDIRNQFYPLYEMLHNLVETIVSAIIENKSVLNSIVVNIQKNLLAHEFIKKSNSLTINLGDIVKYVESHYENSITAAGILQQIEVEKFSDKLLYRPILKLTNEKLIHLTVSTLSSFLFLKSVIV